MWSMKKLDDFANPQSNMCSHYSCAKVCVYNFTGSLGAHVERSFGTKLGLKGGSPEGEG